MSSSQRERVWKGQHSSNCRVGCLMSRQAMFSGCSAEVSREVLDALHWVGQLAAANLRGGIAASPSVIVISEDTMWFCFSVWLGSAFSLLSKMMMQSINDLIRSFARSLCLH